MSGICFRFGTGLAGQPERFLDAKMGQIVSSTQTVPEMQTITHTRTVSEMQIVPVREAVPYTEERGWGFVTEEARREQELLRLPELNSGFEPVWWYQDEDITQVEMREEGCLIADCTGREWDRAGRRIPLLFKADRKAEGNYRIRIELTGCAESGEEALLFLGRRHLAWKGTLKCGQRQTVEGIVNVCAIVPRGKTEGYPDTAVDIALVGRGAALLEVRIEPVSCPTIYIGGDSTVTDQSADYPYAPGVSYSGWGQMLSAYLDERIAVSNHAHSGLTTESFREEGHYSILYERLKPGDYVLLQFAHNDQKLDHLKAEEGYRENLDRYISEIRKKGAYPILVTPIARNTWKGLDGSYNDLLAEYAEAVKRLGSERKVPVIDLHAASKAFVLVKGLEGAKQWFFPNDFTHSNDYGAYQAAGWVAQGLAGFVGKTGLDGEAEVFEESSEAAYTGLAAFVQKGGFGYWEPGNDCRLPQPPEEMKGKAEPAAEVLFADLERPDENLKRAEALPMMIQALKFFPTNVYNDMFEDVIGHEWYAGAVECAWQNGLIPPEMTAERKFLPEKEITMAEFLAMLMNGFRGRMHTQEKDISTREQVPDFAGKAVRESAALGLIDESTTLNGPVKRGAAAELIRRLAL
ncbi:MAG TPA: rhamnogalacturonan acetylesterase [Candidatus Eisenbergiella merdavium]|uniref:Rhamnogalacturonan acetylesterase n=1 Tax=Candidatus Eisenbergiella merdavium TaxID=2838551 RepID=A0A9D2NDR8_9FIRM|nr:rhamnogalacturonan acetylesterase [Candidatus Eisenbergiella merdavium]